MATHPNRDTAARTLLRTAQRFALIGHTHTGAEILAALAPVDGDGSGLDADTLRGNEPSDFAAAIHTHSADDITSGTLDGGTP